MIDRITVAPGLAMPFYPARPMHGESLRSRDQTQAQFEQARDEGKVIQPKLNGDRAVLGVTADGILIANRHGAWLHQTVKNAVSYMKLGAGTVLDGEVVDGHLVPFECLALGGVSLVTAPASERVRMAERCCHLTHNPWLFGLPTIPWLREMRANLPRWEGFIVKAEEPYPIGRSKTDESSRYWKHRW